MSTFLLLAVLAATLVFGGWITLQWTRADERLRAIRAAHRRDCEINDAADMASDGEEREVWL